MEQIAMDLGVAAAGLQQTQSFRGVTAQGGGMDGLFADWFAQLLAGMDPEQQMAELLSGMPQTEDEDESRNLMAMELMAAQLFAPAMLADSDQLQQAADLLAGAGLTGTKPAVSALPGTAGGMLLERAAQDTDQAEEADGWQQLLQSLTAAWQESGETAAQPVTGSLADQLYFQSALRQAQRAVAEKPRAETGAQQPLDLEALQQAADSGRYLAAAVGDKQEDPTLDQIAGQLKTGILENLAQAKKEFVVKLKPEGLGEITVKLLEEKGSISLRIVTSSAAVGRMIAEDVNALQNALRPLNAQVQEIVTPTQQAQDSAAQSYFGADQNQGGFAWQYDGQQQQQSGRGGRRDSQEFDGLVEEALPEDAALNLLI